MLEYLTEDGLFSIDIALRPPPHSRKRRSRQAAAQLVRDAPPAVHQTATSAPSQSSEEAGAAGSDARQSGAGGPLESQPQASQADSGQGQGDDAAESREPAAGGLLMLQPGFRLKGPRRWRPGRGGVLKSQPSVELRVSHVPCGQRATSTVEVMVECCEMWAAGGHA